MKIYSTGVLKELARYCLDISKLTATAAFITPCFTVIDVDPRITRTMAAAALTTFIVGLLVHRLADCVEVDKTQPSRHNDNSRTNNIEGERHGRRRRNRKKQTNY